MTTAGRSLGDATLGLRADASQLEGDLDSAAQTTGQKVQGIGKALTAALTGPILGIGAAVFASTEHINDAFATIQAGTGASGAALEGLENDFRAVFTTLPVDAQTAAAAIADLNGHLGLSGPALQEAATAALELADATGANAAAFIDGLGRSMKIFGEDTADTVSIMDQFLVISQNTGIGVDALAGQVRGFGPVLANLGLNLTEGAAFFGQLHGAGVDVAAVMPAINGRMRQLASEGVTDLRGALDDTITEIREAETVTEALSIATVAFGAEGAQRMTNAIRESGVSLTDLTAGLESADGGIAALSSETRSMSERLEILKNRVTDQIAAFGRWLGPVKDIAGGMGAALAAIGPMLIALPTLVTAVKALSIANIQAAFTTGALGTAMRIALGPVGLAITAIGLLVAAGVALWKNWDTVSMWVRRVWSETVGPVIETVINKIIDGFNLLTQAYRKPLEGLLFVAEKVAGVFNDDVAQSIRNVRNAINEGIPQVEIASGWFDEFAEQGGKAGASMDDLTAEARPAIETMDNLADSTERVSRAVGIMSDEIWRAGGSLSDFVPGLTRAEQIAANMAELMENMAASVMPDFNYEWQEMNEIAPMLAKSFGYVHQEVDDLGVSLTSAAAAQDAMTAAADKATAAAERAALAQKRLVSGYDSLLKRQNPLIVQLKELRVGFDDLFVEIARQRGDDLESFRDYLTDAGVAYGDTLALMELVGSGFALSVAQQFASVRDAMKATENPTLAANRAYSAQKRNAILEHGLAGQALTSAERQAFLATVPLGDVITANQFGGWLAGGSAAAQSAVAGRGTQVFIEGDVYGFDDFAGKVGEANNENRRAGLESSDALS